MTNAVANMYKCTIVILFAVFMSISLKSQGPECFFVHFDKSFYVSGEMIWFKVYSLDTISHVQSRVLHVDLVSHQNQQVDHQKLLLQNGSTFGSIQLPVNSGEGYYRFRAYTRYNLNFNPPVVYQATLPVYQLDNREIPDSIMNFDQSITPSGVAGIGIATDKKVYQPRDSLKISFETDGKEAGNYSVSIVPVELVMPKFDIYQNLKCPDLNPVQGQLKHPEHSLFIEGKLQNALTGQRVNSRLLSIYLDETSQLIRASSRNGRIRVSVPDFWGSGVFQILNHDPYNPSVLELVTESETDFEDPYFNPALPRRSPRVLNYIDQMQKRRKIIELFDLYETPEINTITPQQKIPDAIYQTEDFKQIYSFEQFINEAIQNVRVRMVDSIKTVRLFNRDYGRLFEDHPWYMVDGFLTYNEQEVLQIPYQDIQEVRLYFRSSTLGQYFQGFMLRSGVMEIITREVKYVRELKKSANVAEIEGFAKPQEFRRSFVLPHSRSTPDLRGVMYWSPNVNANESGQGQITVPLSDDTGEFAVVIMGANKLRQPVTGYCTFKIEMK